MIRQICPHCFGSLELGDEAAGTSAECPLCHKAFEVPGRYTPSVAEAAPLKMLPEPAGLVPPAAAPAPPPGLVLPAAALPGASTFGGGPAAPADAPAHSSSLALSPVALDWLPVSCLTLVLLLTFFSWVGLYPGGYKAYAQTPWEAFAGTIDTNPSAEEVLQIETPLKKLLGMNWLLLLPYLLALLAAVALGWADRLIRAASLSTLPPALAFLHRLWPIRFSVLAALALVTLILLALQVRLGFGLENATRQLVANDFTERLQAATNSSARQKLLVEQGMKLGQYELQTTIWLTLALLLHVVAVVAAALRLWLTRRGDKPLPRVTFSS